MKKNRSGFEIFEILPNHHVGDVIGVVLISNMWQPPNTRGGFLLRKPRQIRVSKIKAFHIVEHGKSVLAESETWGMVCLIFFLL